MQITSSTPVMSGSIEDMIAKLSTELEDQAAEQGKASRQAEDVRHQSALQSIEKHRDAATTQMVAGLVNAGAGLLSTGADKSEGEAIKAIGNLVANGLNFHKANQEADAEITGEKAKVMAHTRGQRDEGAQASGRFADKAMTHLSDIQRLIHEARMTSIRG